MPRELWKGAIQFGLVHIPVSLYPAEQRDELSFTMLDRRDLQPVGYKILSAIVRHGPMHAGAIAAELEIDKSVVSRQIRHLEALGLAVGVTDPSDRRARFIEPTPRAIESVGQKSSRMQRQLYEQLRTWSADDVGELARLLGRLTNEVFVTVESARDSRGER